MFAQTAKTNAATWCTGHPGQLFGLCAIGLYVALMPKTLAQLLCVTVGATGYLLYLVLQPSTGELSAKRKAMEAEPKPGDVSEDAAKGKNSKTRRRRKHTASSAEGAGEEAAEPAAAPPTEAVEVESAQARLEEAEGWTVSTGKKKKGRKGQDVQVEQVARAPAPADDDGCADEGTISVPGHDSSLDQECEPSPTPPLHDSDVASTDCPSSTYYPEQQCFQSPYQPVMWQPEGGQMIYPQYAMECPQFPADCGQQGGQIIYLDPSQVQMVDPSEYCGPCAYQSEFFPVCDQQANQAMFQVLPSSEMQLLSVATPILAMEPQEDDWSSCWEWAKYGCCPRGSSCRWEHRPLPGSCDPGNGFAGAQFALPQCQPCFEGGDF